MKKFKFKIKLPKKIAENKFLNKRKGVIAKAGIGAAVIIALLILESIFGIFSLAFFGNEIIIKNYEDISNLQRQIKRDQDAYSQMLERISQFEAGSGNYYIQTKGTDINEEFQKKISAMAKEAKVDLSTAGSVNLMSINEDLSSGSIEISCSGEIEGIGRFIYALSNSSPKMYWERFSLRPDNYQNKSLIYLTCDVKFIIIKNSDIAEFLKGGEEDNE